MGSSLRLLAALSIQALVLFVGIIALTAFAGPHKGAAHAAGAASMPAAPAASLPSPRIQVALLLDVSNSMDGLIDQAKAQLWNTVNLLAKATCQGQQPPISFALYEYGRSNNPVAAGYVRQINGFITDLDSLSMNLFSLSTYGGDEYCGQAMLSSLEQLAWDTGSRSYKVIFIAGNESFRQGPVPYARACEVARQKGVVI
ncbi:MAG TPA: hypothetical protein PKD90_20345, partial [Phnomibacter sp.]|nr:hypothetical protein [Phnomibacter sp.]